MKTYRYHVCIFPSLYGTPAYANYLFLARIIGVWRAIVNYPCEVRIIDKKTGEHYVF